MIPVSGYNPIPSQTYAAFPKENYFRINLIALGAMASLAILAVAPWEIGLSFSACILFISCLASIRSRPRMAMETAPMQCVETVHPVYSPPHLQPRIPPVYRRERPRHHDILPPLGRAPVGTGAPTRFAPARAPVGTSAPTRFALSQRAGVGTR